MSLHTLHIIQRVHASILIISQDKNNVRSSSSPALWEEFFMIGIATGKGLRSRRDQ